MKLVIGNKCYSSWSMRPWLVLKAFAIPFEEQLIRLGQPETRAQILNINPAGRVPVLATHDGAIWETLAIIEYLAETYPDKAIWPAAKPARAMARAAASEMHAGFAALRTQCPMVIEPKPRPFAGYDESANADVARLTALWQECRQRFGQGGPFLFGEFCATDAMFAPVVVRLYTYGWPLDVETAAYVSAMRSHPAFVEWAKGADAEPWFID